MKVCFLNYSFSQLKTKMYSMNYATKIKICFKRCMLRSCQDRNIENSNTFQHFELIYNFSIFTTFILFFSISTNSNCKNLEAQVPSPSWFLRGLLLECSCSQIFYKTVAINNLAKVATRNPATLTEKRLTQGCFLVNFAKFLRVPALQSPPG